MSKEIKNLEDKVIVVTGATGGVGPTVVSRLIESGAEVLGIYRSEGKLERAKERGEDMARASYYQADLIEEAAVEELSTKIEEEYEKISGIVNLVGGFATGSIATTKGEDMVTVFKRQTLTVFFTLKYLGDLLEEGGSVINFSSTRALDSDSGSLAYNVGKSALNSLTKSVDNEAKMRKVRINALAPGIMDTPNNREAMPNSDRSDWTSLEEVADVVEFLLSPKSSSISGQIIRI